MRAIDFEYDGKLLSDFGYIICDLNFSNGITTVDAGANITFNKVAHNGGRRYSLTSTQYDKCLTTTIDICKNPDTHKEEEMEISEIEYRTIARWLSRREYLRLRMLGGCEHVDELITYYNATFNLTKLYAGGIMIGIRANMETDSPYGYAPNIVETLTFTAANQTRIVNDMSDDIGYRYPDVKITINAAGTLTLKNESEGTSTVIKNCTSGEVIRMSGWPMTITSSISGHKIATQFNYEFFRIGNRMDDRANMITASIPCTVTITYAPTVHDMF